MFKFIFTRVGPMVGALLFSTAGISATNTNSSPELSSVREKIQQKQAEIKDQQKDLASLKTQLKTDEAAIDSANKQLSESQTHLARVRAKLVQLENQRRELQTKAAQQTKLLAAQFDEAYRMDSNTYYLKLLLNQEDPAVIDRMMTYYGYITQARLNSLQHMNATKAKIIQNRQDTSASSDELKQVIADQKKVQDSLSDTKAQREKTLAALNNSLQSDQAQLTKLQQAEKDMLKKIEEERKRLEAERLKKKQEALAKAREKAKQEGRSAAAAERKEAARLAKNDLKGIGKAGRMSWPARGSVTHSFGEHRNGEIDWKGILIKVPKGSPVKAASSGDVVFAASLDGFGNVIVIDHGKGYLSLYGNNQSLSKQVGQRVQAGDTIAQSGDSAMGESGIYFEIRRAGQAVNPMQYLH